MEDGKGPTTSTTAAVADGANAVATTKSMTESNNQPQITINTSSTSETSVRLLIKASNQQHDDLAIDSDLLWSVKRLKIYLSSVHPSKPLVHEQKLIYSGQLLNDKLLLKEVIRSYKDVYTQNHIIHLVCSNKNMPLPSLPKINRLKGKFDGNSTVNDSRNGNDTRQRVTVENIMRQGQQQPNDNSRLSQHYNSTELLSNNGQRQQRYQPVQHPQHQQPQTMPRTTSQCTQVSNVNLNPNNWQLLLQQQAAMNNWLHQVYSQYMEHCTRLTNMFSNMNDEGGNVRNIGWPNYTPPNVLPFMIQPFLRPYLYDNSIDASTVIGFPNSAGVQFNNNISESTNAMNGQIPAAVRAPIVQQPSPSSTQQQMSVQPPVQDAVGVAADGAQYPNIIQDETDNRDWLDALFTFVRLMFFLTLLYINTSTQRCLIVFIIAAIMYCYHVGVFRRRHERNNNNLNRNNNADRAVPRTPPAPRSPSSPNTAVDAQRQNNQHEQAANGSDNQQMDDSGQDITSTNTDNLSASRTTSATSSETVSINNNSVSSALAFMQTFIVTFFTSLFPETPAL